jgi:tetratricopeptide (TPR) repeat protein
MKTNQVPLQPPRWILGAASAVCVAAIVISLPGGPPRVLAEEPASKFLERLKEEGLYDQAVRYLDISTRRNRLPESMKSEIDLERILLLQLSLKDVRNDKELADKLAAIEKGFKDFLSAWPEHPRRSETMLKLADMFLARGGQDLDQSKLDVSSEGDGQKVSELRSQARKSFQQAFEIFGETTTYLRPILEKMQGANVKPNETERLALREKLQTEYRQAQILQAITSKFLAETFDPNSSEWKSNLESADQKLGEIVDKSSKQAGAKYLSLLNRGHVQALLGQIDAARDSYQRVAENEEPGVFRTWRVQAVAGMVRLDSSPASSKYEAAVMRGEEQWRQGDIREKDRPEWQDLQFAIAQARIAWMNALDPKTEDGKIRNIRREAREGLQALVKKPGATQKKAADLLKTLGIEAKVPEDTQLPEAKTFEEAIKAARSRSDRAMSGLATLSILEGQLEKTAPADQGPIQEQIDQITNDAQRDREQAIELNAKAFTMYRDSDSRDDLLQARLLQSFLYYQVQRYREAFAIADVIVRTHRGTEAAEKAGDIALASLADSIQAAPSEQKPGLTAMLEGLAKKFLEIAPGTPQSEKAVDVLARLAIGEQRWDDAEKVLALKKGPPGMLEFILGHVRWIQYRQASFQRRREGQAETEQDKELLVKAESTLTTAWNALAADDVNTATLEGTNDLVAMSLQAGRLDDAMRYLNEPGKGAMAQLEAIPAIEAKSQLETQRLRLQAMVQSAAQGRGAMPAEQVAASIETLRGLSDQSGDPNMLSRTLRNLAVDIQNQLELTNDVGQKANLADSYQILVDQLVGVSTDASTLESLGASVTQLASAWENVPGLQGKVASMMVSAEKAFDKLLALPPSEQEKLQRKPEELLLSLALAKRGAGKFDEAHKLFIQGLQKSPNNLTIQIEAAKNLQLSSKGKDAEKLRQAMLGAEPQANKKNLVWGWGQIAQRTMNAQNFQDQFFDARWNIARCRSYLADIENDPDKKKKLYEASIKDIEQTRVRFPELGGPIKKAEFDRLLREVQQKAGK